jgi:hypothetical protein
VPEELSINLTVIGAQPAVGPAEKFATGWVIATGWPISTLLKNMQAINVACNFNNLVFNGDKIIKMMKQINF